MLHWFISCLPFGLKEGGCPGLNPAEDAVMLLVLLACCLPKHLRCIRILCTWKPWWLEQAGYIWVQSVNANGTSPRVARGEQRVFYFAGLLCYATESRFHPCICVSLRWCSYTEKIRPVEELFSRFV